MRPLHAVASVLLLACAAVAEEARVAAPAQSSASAKVQSLLPKYNPRKPVNTPVDRRETDRPRNGIVRLPKEMLPPESIIASSTTASAENTEPASDGVVRLPLYDVRTHRLPSFKEREILSPSARVDLHFKRHPGLRIGNLFGLNRGIARAMIAEQDEYDRRREMADLLSFQSFADSQPRPKEDRD